MAVDHVARGMAMDAGGGAAPVDITQIVTEAVSKIVADAPEDFDTLKEMSDWIASHEDSAAAMNSAIMQNAADIEAVETQQTEQAESISAAAEGVAINRSTLGYQRKNLFNFSAWIASIGNTPVRGTQVTTSDSVTLTATSNDCFTNNYNVEMSGHYKIPVEPLKKYILSWSSNNNLAGSVYVFLNGNTDTLAWVSNSKAKSIEFTTMSNTSFITFRVGVMNLGNSITYSNIMLRYADITDDTYEPYKPSVQEQITSLETIVDSAFVSGENISGNGGDDLNTVTKSGQYKYSGSPANRPGTQTYGVLIVYNPMNKPYQGSSTYVVQVAIAGVNAAHFGVASSAGVYVRTSANGGTEWSEWLKMMFENTTSAANMLNAENLEQTD